MEYCEKIVGSDLNRKKIKTIFAAAAAMVFMAGVACEMPSWEWGTVYQVKKAGYTEKKVSPTERDGKMLETNVTLLENIGKFDIPVRTLQETIADDKIKPRNMISRTVPQESRIDFLETMSITNGNGISEILPDRDSTISSVPADSMVPAAPAEENASGIQDIDIPAESIVPEIPGGAVVPDVPNQNVTPDIPHEDIAPDIAGGAARPDIPGGEARPDTPGEEAQPDIPGGEERPDIPGEETQPDIPEEDVVPDMPPDSDIGNMDATRGFEVDSNGMIYCFKPDEAVLEDGGYLLLPSEGCSGILSGTFIGVGAGIYDLFIPSNITYIEDNAFYGLDELYGIDVEENHPNYASEGGVMFDKTRSVLLAFPEARIGTFAVPQGVAKIADSAFANTNLEKLDMRTCGLIEVGSFLFGESDGNGIAILAPKEYLTEYQEIFAGYNVIVQ